MGWLPADPVKLRAAFYKAHRGKPHAANKAWNAAVKNAGLVPITDGITPPLWLQLVPGITNTWQVRVWLCDSNDSPL